MLKQADHMEVLAWKLLWREAVVLELTVRANSHFHGDHSTLIEEDYIISVHLCRQIRSQGADHAVVIDKSVRISTSENHFIKHSCIFCF